MTRSGIWIAIAGVAAVVAGLGMWRTKSAPAHSAAADTDAELRAVRQELGELKRALRESRLPPPPPIAPNAFPGTPPAPPASAESAPPEEPSIANAEEFEAMMKARQEEAASKGRARRERIESNLRAEPRDARWASEATTTIQGWMGDPGLAGANLQEVDCRTSICRAHIRLPEGKQVDDFLLTTMDKMGTFQTTSLHVLDKDGSKREFVAYLGRQGQPLPQ